jgi:3D (Asp-Asp-Asp) domain-containing protein
MFKKMVVAATLMLALVAGGISHASAQESSSAKVTSEEKTVNAYRLDFSVNELEDGKKINTRQYAMNLNADDANEIKIGTRVPIESKQGEFQYLDVGTNIWCRIGERVNGLPLSVRAEISNFAMPMPEQQEHANRPVLRQLSIKASTLAQLGRPMVIGSVDDPNSKRQFQLEVTVTKLK